MYFLAGMIFLFTANLSAQKTMDADQIISMIDEGKAVRLENVTIKGNLGFVKVQDREKKSGSMFGTDTYESHINVPVSFTNCTFDDDVIAYFNDDD